MQDFNVIWDPGQRAEHIARTLEPFGLGEVEEDPDACYCGISLTTVPPEAKPVLKDRQKILMQTLKGRGFDAYDPGSSDRYSPDLNLEAQPAEVFAYDAARVAAARYFSGFGLVPSDGRGVESALAFMLNKVSVVLLDNSIRISRMMPACAVYLGYDDVDEQQETIGDVFSMLHDFEPGLGSRPDTGNGPLRHIPILLGFEKQGNRIVPLEDEIQSNFPGMTFSYDPGRAVLPLHVDPSVFYENH